MAHIRAGNTKIDTPNGLVLIEINGELNKIILAYKNGEEVDKIDIKLLELYENTLTNFNESSAPDGNLCSDYLQNKIHFIYKLME